MAHLSPIPARILKQSATLRVCSGVDMWQKPTWTETTLGRICVQTSNETRKTRDNTEVVLRSICFVDAVRSTPRGLDLDDLQQQSEQNGQPMALVFRGVPCTVLTVETLYDDTGQLHHWELGLGGAR